MEKRIVLSICPSHDFLSISLSDVGIHSLSVISVWVPHIQISLPSRTCDNNDESNSRICHPYLKTSHTNTEIYSTLPIISLLKTLQSFMILSERNQIPVFNFIEEDF